VSHRARGLALGLGLVVAIAACSSGGGGDGTAVAPLVATKAHRGSTSTPCPYSHSEADDPIVHPGMHGMSHRHDFFGATATASDSTAKSLLKGGTTCRTAADKTAYWAPSLLADGTPLRPKEMTAYYRVPLGADARKVQALPNGLEMIAGDAESATPQDPAVMSWSCGLADATSAVPQPCTRWSFLTLRLTFDPCWDGEHLGSADHRSHLAALRADGACPGDHPVLIPELHVEIRYPVTPVGTQLTLSSGAATGGHGDALVAWDGDDLDGDLKPCLQANRRCDVLSESTRLSIPQVGQ